MNYKINNKREENSNYTRVNIAYWLYIPHKFK